MKKSIKEKIIDEINRQIVEIYPNENLTPLTYEMNNPNDIADYGVVARYINEELYFMYWDVEDLTYMNDKFIFLSQFAKDTIYNEKSWFGKIFFNINKRINKCLYSR